MHNVNKNKQRYYRKNMLAKSGRPVTPYSIYGTLFPLFVVNILQEKTFFHLFTENMDGLFHKITEWCIKYGVIKTTENCFNLPNNV